MSDVTSGCPFCGDRPSPGELCSCNQYVEPWPMTKRQMERKARYHRWLSFHDMYPDSTFRDFLRLLRDEKRYNNMPYECDLCGEIHTSMWDCEVE